MGIWNSSASVAPQSAMSLKHVVHQRVHQERPQPKARQRLGLLEKHKDYVKRAKDWHKKEKTIKNLEKKAFYKNPDEFAFGMVSHQLENGKLRKKPQKECLRAEEQALAESQDVKYIAMREQIDKKAAERQQRSLHFIDADRPNKQTLFLDDDDDDDAEVQPAFALKRKLQDYDVAAHFDTHPALLGKKGNRLTLKQLETGKFADPEEMGVGAQQAYRALFGRQERAKKLEKIRTELEMRKHCRGKGKRTKVAEATDTHPAVFKWEYKRKR